MSSRPIFHGQLVAHRDMTQLLALSTSLLACLLASIFYHEVLGEPLHATQTHPCRLCERNPSPSAMTNELLFQKMGGGEGKVRWSAARAREVVLVEINLGIRYLLMLALMSFNGRVFLAVVLGLIIGYLLFRSEDENSTLPEYHCACA
ncbi:solute carrier family (copper transporter), member [Salix suchowensis]|nr:solute carrier family (copper transporter), member [Salix suchowensis]